jgi:hypothetical protein
MTVTTETCTHAPEFGRLTLGRMIRCGKCGATLAVLPTRSLCPCQRAGRYHKACLARGCLERQSK